jgi:hypothetical protein
MSYEENCTFPDRANKDIHTTVFLDQLVDVIAPLVVALGAFAAEHVELALDVAEDEVGSGHGVPQI